MALRTGSMRLASPMPEVCLVDRKHSGFWRMGCMLSLSTGWYVVYGLAAHARPAWPVVAAADYGLFFRFAYADSRPAVLTTD